MKKNQILIFFFVALTINAQIDKKNKIPDWHQNIQGQFEEIYNKSGNYLNYKVVKSSWIQHLKRDVLDTLDVQKQNVLNMQTNIYRLEKVKDSLQAQLLKDQKEINNLKQKNKQITFFGFSFLKTTYNLILWSLILILIFIVVIVVYKYLDNHQITKETLDSYKELSDEFDTYRTKNLEKIQSLQRKLLDEINKNKNN